MKNFKLTWKNCFMVGTSIFLLYLAITYWKNVSELISTALGAAAPLVIGGVIAYLVNILMVKYEKWWFPGAKKKFWSVTRRPVCMTAAYITLVAIIAAIFALVVPQLYDCVILLVSEIPGVIKSIIALLDKYDLLSDKYLEQLYKIDWKSRLDQIIGIVTSGVGDVMNMVISTVTALFSGVVTAFIAVIFSVYLLLSKERIASQCHRLMRRFMKEIHRKRALHVLSVADRSFRGYIVGQCTEAVILGMLCMVGMWILRIPYAPMVGAFVAFTALIPIAGAYIGAAVGAFMILTVSPVKALIFLVFLLALQQFEGNLIFPKVVGDSIGLPGIWVLAAVTVGGGVMGVVGMLIAVPIAATIYKLLAEQVNNPVNILTSDDVARAAPEKKPEIKPEKPEE